ncbi:unnamed protein product [Trichobilharzia regenti]|nr:unnamed protein product [Trichobilharzia regenti]
MPRGLSFLFPSTGQALGFKTLLHQNKCSVNTRLDNESITALKLSLQSHLPWRKCTSNQETINIFSVASGHLYERLLRYVILFVNLKRS